MPSNVLRLQKITMKLKILTDDETIVSICQMYWELDERARFVHHVEDIAVKFSTTIKKVCSLTKENATTESESLVCKSCDLGYSYLNRSDYYKLFKSMKNVWTCDACVIDHEVSKYHEKKHAIAKRNDAIREMAYCPVIAPTFKESLFVTALVKFSISNDLAHLASYDSCAYVNRLTPEEEFDFEIYKHLYHNKFIQVDPSSNLGSVNVNKDGVQFDITKVGWLLTPPKNGSLLEHIKDNENFCQYRSCLTYMFDDVQEIICMLSYYECLSYLKFVMCEYKFYATPGKKAKIVFDKILEKYSVAQTWRLIWMAVRTIASDTRRVYYSQNHAVNAIIYKIESLFEKYVSEDTLLPSFNRPKELPQSLLSRLIFFDLLGADDLGFHMPLSEMLEQYDKRYLDPDCEKFFSGQPLQEI